MRTAANLKQMIADNNDRLTSIGLALTKREIKNLSKRNEVLRELMQYLQTNPKEEFILSEKKRLKTIIAAKQSQFYNWKTLLYGTNACAMSPTKQSRLFCKETGITQLRKQLKNLNFLLNENREQPATR